MKKLVLGACFLLLGTTAWASCVLEWGDPRDSIIIEFKTVASGLVGTPAGTPVFEVLVYTTNKDSLSSMVLSCTTKTISGGGYALLNRTASGQLTHQSIVRPLTPFGSFFTAANTVGVNDASPDAFLVAGGANGTDPGTNWPPHAVRTPVWALKFRASSATPGQMLFGYATVAGCIGAYFTNTRSIDVPANFLPGVLTIEECQKGDLNCGGDDVTGADIVWEIRCVLGGETPPAGRGACDLNCDGELSAADIITMITYNFVTLTWPC